MATIPDPSTVTRAPDSGCPCLLTILPVRREVPRYTRFVPPLSVAIVATTCDAATLRLRSLSVAASHVVATIATDSGGTKRVYRGTSRLTGKIVNKQGQPLSGARVTVEGSGIVAISRANGEFSLDSLPAGTQSLDVRKLGYGA